MSLRAKLVLLFTAAILATVAAVTALVTLSTNRAYIRMDEERSQTLGAEVRQEFSRQLDQVTEQTQRLANSEAMQRLAAEMARSAPDYSQFVNAPAQLTTGELDVVELLTAPGAIIASKHWPARFGYTETWFNPALNGTGAFLQSLETPTGSALAILSEERIGTGDQGLYLVAGRKLDATFLQGFVPPPGVKIFLYRPNAEGQDSLVSAGEDASFSESLRRAARQALQGAGENESAHVEGQEQTVRAFPLLDRQQKTADVLLIANSEAGRNALVARIRWLAALVAAAGIVAGVLLSMMIAGRFTQPVEELAAAADRVAAGDLRTQVDEPGSDEVGRLAHAFNRMTRELVEEREKLVQSERVAAWRELARRLAHELKNPLFPLQITVENLLRARRQGSPDDAGVASAGVGRQQPQQFDEVFEESAKTLLSEIQNLKTVIERFSDFSKMPRPELETISINDAVRKAVRTYEPQFQSNGRPPIAARWELDPAFEAANVRGDPELLHRALSNLVSNAMDAMPQGGSLTLRTRRENGRVRIEVADTGAGITEEEARRLFTPYYTSKQHGTGLGLAIVQSVVSDHKGKVWTESQAGRGSTFIIELPVEG